MSLIQGLLQGPTPPIAWLRYIQLKGGAFVFQRFIDILTHILIKMPLPELKYCSINTLSNKTIYTQRRFYSLISEDPPLNFNDLTGCWPV